MLRRQHYLAALVLATTAVGLGAFWPFSARRPGLRLPGTVQSQEVRLGSKVGGRVVALLVAEGDRVTAGQELVRLELPELEAQRDQLRARLALAQADLAKARKGPRPLELREAEEAWKAAEARWRRICADPRTEEVDQIEHEKAAGAKSKLQLLHAGSREEEREEAKAERDRLRAKLDLLREGTREEDLAHAEAEAEHAYASLREVETRLREASLRAHDAGRIEVLSVRPGDLAQPNSPIVRMLRDGDQWVRAFVPETELGKLRVGQAVEVTIDSHPGQPFPGTLYYIASESEFTPRNVQSVEERRHQVFAVKVRVDAPAGTLKPGMAAEVFLPTEGSE